MNNLADPGVISDILKRHGFTFSKGLGQNFLVNPTVCPRMAEASGAGPGVGALEIGPGIGVLTAELAKRADRVVSLEIDQRLLPILQETLAGFEQVKILNADVLKTDLHRLIAEEFAGLEVVVCANLPYYITSPVIMKLLEETPSGKSRYRHGAKGGGSAPVRPARHPCVRSRQRRRSFLRGAGNSLPRLLRQLPARAERRFCCYSPANPKRAAGGGPQPKKIFRNR